MDIRGEEIMSVGTWNKISFGESDLDGFVSAFNALNQTGRVPLKFGHTEKNGMPAIGWVSKIWRDGKKLMADFTDVPLIVYEAIKKKLYKFVSIEALRDVRAGTRTIPWVLDAVALLGADPPAVGDLKALQALTMSRSSVLQGRERWTFKRDNTIGAKDMSITPEDMERRLKEQREEFARKETESNNRFAALEAERLKDKAQAKRDIIKLKFDRAVTDGKLLPRSFEKFSALYKLSDDKACVDIKDADVESFMAEREEVDAPEIKKNKKGGAKETKEGENEVESGTRAEVLMARAQKEILAFGGKTDNHEHIERATKVVLKRDPEFAKAYFEDSNAPFEVSAGDEEEDK